ncbi:GcrA family cell cycle regulator [Pelagibacterium sp.]|uniref:GcrA family cell cycle regulator n=1 Tax=Pelagibacterium sp. TaxID=1967288 RepID=UPI003BAD0B5F
MSWTDERVALLKKLWMEGLSASQIAAELSGGVTRNAVIGKVHRLKLSARAKPASVAPRAKAQRPTAPRRPSAPSGSRGTASAAASAVSQRRTTMAPTMGATALKMDAELEAEMVVETNTKAELFIPIEERISLLQLTEKTCKWPIGDPMSSEFHFCGRESDEGKPYCEFHSRRAYHQIDRKKR